MFQNFIMINKTFKFKLFLSGNKFGFASNIWTCLSANITIHNAVTGIISEPQKLQSPNFQISWNLRFSALEPEPSSLFWFILVAAS